MLDGRLPVAIGGLRHAGGTGRSAPHLNGTVERAPRTVLDEFRAQADLALPDIADQAAGWLEFYDTSRPHSALGGLTPAERLTMLQAVVPTDEAVRPAYEPAEEWLRTQHTRWDTAPTR